METRTSGSAGGHGKRTRGNPDTAPVPDLTAMTRWDHANQGPPLVSAPGPTSGTPHAVGKYVYDTVQHDGDLHLIADFFHDLRRHG